MTSRKARRFRTIFARNFLKIHTFFMKYWYFSELSCDKKNLKWIFISYGIYETRCVFYIPSPKARGYKTHNSFHKTVWNENWFQILYILIFLINSITLNIITNVYVLVFHLFTARTEAYVWRHQEWRHILWRHVVAFNLCLDCVNKTIL